MFSKKSTVMRILPCILSLQIIFCLFPLVNSSYVAGAQSRISNGAATITDYCTNVTSTILVPEGIMTHTADVVYNGFSANDFTVAWGSSSPVCPDPSVVNIVPELSTSPCAPATVTYTVNGASEVRVSAYSFTGSTAWDMDYEGAYLRGYDTSKAFDATKLLNVLLDPIDGRLYIHLPGGQWATFSDWPFYRFYQCDGTRTYAVAPADPTRLVPLGVGIQYSSDGTTWNYASKQIVSSVNGGGTNNYYETWKALLPDGVKYVKVSLNDRNTAYNYNVETGVIVPVDLGNARTWNTAISKIEIDCTFIKDDFANTTAKAGVVYSEFSANDFTAVWNSSSPVCPDPTVLNIQSVASAYPGAGSPATVTYKANGATKVMVSAYSDVGTTAWDIDYEGAYFRGYDTSKAFDATKLLNVLIDPVDGKLYIHLPGGQWAVYSDWFYYRFYPCDGTRAYAVAPAVPSRLVPLGVGIQYSTDGTTWNYAAKQIVSSVKGGGTNNYYETWKALLPDGVQYVRVSLNERNTAYNADTGVQVPLDLGSYSTWSCGLASVEIDCSLERTLTNIVPGTTVNDYINYLDPGLSANTIFTKLGATITGDSKIGTGTKITATFNSISTNYTILIYGDVTGDGLIEIGDLAAIKEHIIKITMLTDEYKTAGDISVKGSVSISDLLAVKKSILGLATINQNPNS
jgi:hypothetical protein